MCYKKDKNKRDKGVRDNEEKKVRRRRYTGRKQEIV